MEETTEEYFREVLGSKHYTEWTPLDFQRDWEHYIESYPDNYEWELKYLAFPENIVTCNKAIEKMRANYSFTWSMTVDGQWLIIRATREMEELNITL